MFRLQNTSTNVTTIVVSDDMRAWIAAGLKNQLREVYMDLGKHEDHNCTLVASCKEDVQFLETSIRDLRNAIQKLDY